VQTLSLGNGLKLFWGEEGDLPGCSLLQDEEALLPVGVHPRRRAQFTLGRGVARAALGELGFVDVPVLQGKRGEPLWPAGVCGSLSHTYAVDPEGRRERSVAVCAVSASDAVKSLGIDIEFTRRKLSLGISAKTCSPEEADFIFGEKEDREKRLISLLSAKEAVYKALYPLTQVFFGFLEAKLTWDSVGRCFQGALLKDLTPAFRSGFEFQVHSLSVDSFFLHWIVIR
jgi:4'-phosphopantetheinyl transferase EntD